MYLYPLFSKQGFEVFSLETTFLSLNLIVIDLVWESIVNSSFISFSKFVATI